MSKLRFDWTTVEIVGERCPIEPHVLKARRRDSRAPYAQRAKKSSVKTILAGAAMKARGRGAPYTHAQICDRLERGLEMLGYGFGLVAAATAPEFAKRVEIAAYVIGDTAERLIARAA